ncbi:CLUMA_CG016130, isoform A [Clunio marinus]|uniref:CLUMA_CG016130, isoform A n=1 Tax=Clunio marinus TaxID=568069 RepID=A0A1J1IUQ3_9DIPT|nr:CLUMA_CG016130, isoform A [Clunio marinus]
MNADELKSLEEKSESQSKTFVESKLIKNTICHYCDKIFLKNSDLQRHILSHTNERNFKCLEIGCNKNFKLKNTLERHAKTHQKHVFSCNVCLSTYSSFKALEYHKKVHSSVHIFQLFNIDIESETKVTKEMTYPATQHSTNNLSKSEHVHEKVREVIVDIDMSTNIPLKIMKKFFCEICGKSFTKPVDYRRHSDAVHNKKRPFSCSINNCNKSFSLKCTLQRHMKTHEFSRKLLICDICKKPLRAKCSLKLHKLLHDNIKPHKCNECGLKFRTPGNMKKHFEIHKIKTLD